MTEHDLHQHTAVPDRAGAISLDRDNLVIVDPELGDARDMTDAEWAQVSATIQASADAGERNLDTVAVNDELVDAAGEPRDPDPYVAALQDDRDRCAARGDFDRAEDLNTQVQDLRHPTLDLPAQRTSEQRTSEQRTSGPVTLDDVDREAAQDRVDRADPDLARLMDARDHQAAGGQFDAADASQRLINHLRAKENLRAVPQAGLPTVGSVDRGRDAGREWA